MKKLWLSCIQIFIAIFLVMFIIFFAEKIGKVNKNISSLNDAPFNSETYDLIQSQIDDLELNRLGYYAGLGLSITILLGGFTIYIYKIFNYE